MPNLIDQVCDIILQIPEEEIHRTAVIFPGRRAGTVLRRQLARRLDKPIFTPAILSLPDLLEIETNSKISDPIQLSFDLYSAYLALQPQESFESYLKWGPAVLRDFSEIDAYLLDANQVFGYLSQEKAIDLWEPDKGYLGESAQQFLDFFRQLGNLYEGLKEKCDEHAEGWQSLLCRRWCNQLNTSHPASHYNQYVFAGFNALNPAEQQAIKALIRMGKARLLLDADAYYTEGEHEAGLFLRKLAKDPFLGKDITYNGKLLATDTYIKTIACPGQTAQVQQASEIVHEWLEAGIAPEDCVIVLGDENLLIPLLSALPPACKELNITMGYPLLRSHAFALVQSHIQLIEQLRSIDSQPSYYTHQLIQLLLNPLFNADMSQKAVVELQNTGRIRISIHHFPENLKKHTAFALLNNPGDPNQCLALWQSCLLKLAESHPSDELQSGMCLQMVQILRQITHRLHEFPELNRWSVFKPFFRQQLQSAQLAFLGEPYQGLQIMGLLETRALAYPYIMVLGMNEGRLPANSRQDGFITYSLRQEFGLPGAREKEAVYAYHFYRLLQHAQKSWLLCSSNTDDMGQGEVSRYIKQLSMEWPGRLDGRLIEKHLRIPDIHTDSTSGSIVITKTKEVLQQLHKALERPLSPSALIQWQSCKLKFYFSRVLGLRQQTELQDELDARELGDILHKTLEYLYTPYLNRRLTAADCDKMEQEAAEKLKTAISECYPHRNFESGLNLIIKQIAADYLTRFLNSEKKLCSENQLEIIGLEAELSTEIKGPNGPVVIRGIADRIERLNGRLRVADYKTGMFKPAEVKLQELPEDFANPNKSKAFQLLCYAWLYQRSTQKPIDELDSRIISFRKLNSPEEGFLEITGGVLNADLLQQFEEHLSRQVAEILNPNQAFDQTADIKTCEACDFQKICNR
jgi:ATP-dependent helicase/nuclease subunit B